MTRTQWRRYQRQKKATTLQDITNVDKGKGKQKVVFEMVKKPTTERILPPLSILKKDHPKEDEEMTSNFTGSDPSLDIVCNVVSILPVEYDVQSEINEVESDFVDEMAIHKPLCYYVMNNGCVEEQHAVFEKPDTSMKEGVTTATVNLLPQSFLGKIGVYDSDLKPHNVILTNYEGTSGNSLGAIELELVVGSTRRITTFMVVPSKANFNVLLGREWIHGVGAVPSTVHQRITIWKEDGQVENVEADQSYFLAEVNTITKKNFDKQLAHIAPVISPGPKKMTSSDEIYSMKLQPEAGFVWEKEFRDHNFVMVNQQEVQIENEGLLETRAQAYKKKSTAYLAENEFQTAKEAECLKQEEIEKLADGSIDDGVEDQKLDCIYDDEPLGFEEDPMGSTTKMKAQDPLEEIDLGDGTVKRPTYVSAKIPEGFKSQIAELLKEYKDCFAWDYNEMPGLNREVVELKLPIRPDKKPVKQIPRRFAPQILPKIKEEIDRLLKCGFIRPARYVDWLANVVPVKKKNGTIRVCIDFRDLNLATPKDEYPMPVAEMLVDSAAGFDYLSMLDGYSGYNQIFIAEEDIAKTAFRCPGALGCYEWLVMPFGLKNAGVTYQRAMNLMFHDFIENFMQVYIDDIVVKSSSEERHLEHLRQSFEKMRQYGLKMNPLKCAFEVCAGDFLGFVVHKKGIEINQNKTKAIIETKAPSTKKELQSLLGKINFLRRFISNLSGKTQAFSPLLRLKKDDVFKWEPEHQKAFDEIKSYLVNPPVLSPLLKGRRMKLYIATSDGTIGSMLAQEDEHGTERAIYYLSRVLNDVETRYHPSEKLCLCLFFSCTKLKHYKKPFDVYVYSHFDIIKHMLSKPILHSRVGKWALALTEYSLTYQSLKAVKGQIVADFIVDHSVDEILTTEIENHPWNLYFDGSSHKNGTGVGIVIISPKHHVFKYMFRMNQLCSNNEAEYEALITGLEIALELGARYIEIKGDSELVLRQMTKEYRCVKESLVTYHAIASRLLKQFTQAEIRHVPRMENQHANDLA
ncbi:uncharacterized protein [Medicago truncatula]|uniref:uncharacterized protein n=1 Tax=Medicago truncatula TaxID=3880 RepID=UPI001967772C|nr:uncharacterized protein LOC120578357 [Medicago truncatula]